MLSMFARLRATRLTARQHGSFAACQATLNLPAAARRIYWFADGRFVGAGRSTCLTLPVPLGGRVEVHAVPTRYDDPDVEALRPRVHPADRLLRWTAGSQPAARYRIEHATGKTPPASWETAGWVRARTTRWYYEWRTGPLADLVWHWWRIMPVDAAGLDGTPIVIGPDYHVRRPDPPDVSWSYNPADRRITFGA